ncbi:homeodomain-like, Myb-like domain protein [Artemisia annua]|uniref:Homeodomain-like, Myb-like domain protein n=1 Tax=Artemisia annua TaxID=35608 RepID=A0A2U1KSA5_ARTAN|nr:homeodomain-like, Myb-like domain protein [Artemisia annua]
MSDNGGVATPLKAVVDEQQPQPMTVEVVDDKNKSPRHPRWTRQETLTLIEGKKVAEERGRRGRKSSSVLGLDHVEPKWDAVSSYCKQRSVNRGPVQCRKRWSNMVGDFKKIKAWESQVNQECDSYWLIRSDLRKENKLPGFFDKEVFDVLDGKAVTKAAYKLALVTVSANADEKRYQLFPQDYTQGTFKGQQTNSVSWREGCTSQAGFKRRKVSTDKCQDKNIDDRLIEVLEKNTSMLNARLEAENTNCQLDREQRKDYNDNLVSALNKISDALAKIADKI